jgi:hypothetical protein
LPAGQELVQRQAGDLGGGVPESHIESADRHAALAVAAGFLAAHHDGPGPEGVEAGAVIGADVPRRRPQQPRCEAFPDQPALGVAADRGEPVAGHRLPGQDHIRDDRDEARGESA